MPRTKRLRFVGTLVLAAIVLVAYQASRAGGQVEGVVSRVLDGDTLYVGAVNIRLQGIAAPELDEPLGPEARDFLTAVALGRTAKCELTGERSLDRQVAVCRIDGQDLGRVMIENWFGRRIGGALDLAAAVELVPREP
jgi:endonuclease YncB( thermonuclease family)